MNMKLVTGNTRETSVEAADDRALNAGILGKGDYVLNIGQCFAHQILENNVIRIFDGDGVAQGAHFRIPYGKYDDIQIESSVFGYKRIDLICAKYYKYQNAETMGITVIKGIESSETPYPPEVATGSILTDAFEHNMPLKKVTIQGTTIASVENVFEIIPSVAEIRTSNLLWSGEEQMQADTVIKLPEAVSQQSTGIELVFAPFVNGKAAAYDHSIFFASKERIAAHENGGLGFPLVYGTFDQVGKKLFRINDNEIIGNAQNTEKGTKSGITYNNSSFVLIEVYGV